MNTRTAWMALLMLALLLAGPARAAVTASVDRDRVTLSESFSLEIRVDDMLNSGEPDLEPLTRDFEVLGTQRSSSFTLGSGGRQSSTTWQVELMPRREGELLIPAIRIGKERTQPVRITVGADPRSARTATSDILLEVETDAPVVHVQQQLLLTVRVLHAVDLSRGATLEAPGIDDAVLRELGEKSFETSIEGRRFGVFERRYAVFPQKSGELRIPPLAFEASVGGGGIFDQFSSRARRVRLHSEEKRIRVLPPEPGAAPWLPARMLTLIETWDRSPQELRVGDSATRTVTITAHGLTGAQLPPLSVPDVPGLRFYADQPRIEDAQQADGLSGTRVESSAVIPERAGEIEFPEVKLRWWDTANARFEEAVIPRRTIRVLPASGVSSAPDASAAPAAPAGALPDPAAAPEAVGAPAPPGAAAGQPWPWIIATLLFALATAFTSFQWWRARQRVPHAPAPASPAARDAREAELFAALADACRAADVPRLQALLPRWGRLAYPHAPVRSAADVATAAGDDALAAELERLLASRYAAEPGSADASALLRQLESARAAVLARRKREPGSGALPPLYRDQAGSAGAEPLSG